MSGRCRGQLTWVLPAAQLLCQGLAKRVAQRGLKIGDIHGRRVAGKCRCRGRIPTQPVPHCLLPHLSTCTPQHATWKANLLCRGLNPKRYGPANTKRALTQQSWNAAPIVERELRMLFKGCCCMELDFSTSYHAHLCRARQGDVKPEAVKLMALLPAPNQYHLLTQELHMSPRHPEEPGNLKARHQSLT